MMKLKRVLAALLAAFILMVGSLSYVAVFAEEESSSGESSSANESSHEESKEEKQEEAEPAREASTPEPTKAPATEAPTAIPTIAPDDEDEEDWGSDEPIPTIAPEEDEEDPIETLEPEITEEPTPSPTPEAGQGHISISGSSSQVAYVNVPITFHFKTTNLKSLSYRINNSSGTKVASGKLSADAESVSLTPTKTGEYTLILTGKDLNGNEVVARTSVTVQEPPELTLSVKADHLCCHAGDPTTFTLSVTTGIEYKSIRITATQNSKKFYDHEGFESHVTVTPPASKKVTDVTLTLSVVDALGREAEASATIPCAVHDRETQKHWEATMAGVYKNGNWAHDLIAIAETQVGYRESQIDFGEKHGGGISAYTRYGDWKGMDYDEWCAMFAAFCLHYAGISEENFARASNCQRWINRLVKQDLYADRGDYTPQLGDIVFFEWNGDSASDHVGIVYKLDTDRQGDVVGITTIEGNSKGGKVTDNDYYKLTDRQIVGYGLLNVAYERHMGGTLVKAEATVDPEAGETENPEVTPAPTLYPNQRAAESEGIRVTADLTKSSLIPKDAQMVIEVVSPEDEGYDAYVELLRESLTEGELGYARFVEVHFLDDQGNEVVPEEGIALTVTHLEKLNASRALKPGVATIGGGDGVSFNTDVSLSRADESSTFAFEQDEFGGVICTYVSGDLKYKKNAIEAATDGATAKLGYTAEAGVPAGCALQLREILPGSEEYALCMGHLENLSDKETVRLFEVGVTLNGMDIQPRGPITLTFNLFQSGETARALRISDGQTCEARLTHRLNGMTSVRFDSDGAGIYALVFGE